MNEMRLLTFAFIAVWFSISIVSCWECAGVKKKECDESRVSAISLVRDFQSLPPETKQEWTMSDASKLARGELFPTVEDSNREEIEKIVKQFESEKEEIEKSGKNVEKIKSCPSRTYDVFKFLKNTDARTKAKAKARDNEMLVRSKLINFDGYVTYSFHKSLPDNAAVNTVQKKNRDSVTAAVKDYLSNTCIYWKKVNSNPKVLFKLASYDEAYTSNNLIGPHVIKLSNVINSGLTSKNTALHEMGHALGLEHEHQSPNALNAGTIIHNKDLCKQYLLHSRNGFCRNSELSQYGSACCTLLFTNLVTKCRREVCLLDWRYQYKKKGKDSGVYDPRSIMHYTFDPCVFHSDSLNDINKLVQQRTKGVIATDDALVDKIMQVVDTDNKKYNPGENGLTANDIASLNNLFNCVDFEVGDRDKKNKLVTIKVHPNWLVVDLLVKYTTIVGGNVQDLQAILVKKGDAKVIKTYLPIDRVKTLIDDIHDGKHEISVTPN